MSVSPTATAHRSYPAVTREQIETWVRDAELAPLLATLADLLGDEWFIRDEVRPPLTPARAEVAAQGGMDPDTQDCARRTAVVGLERLFAGDQAPEGIDPSRIMSYLTGNADPAYAPMLARELGSDGDTTAPDWHADDFPETSEFSALVIGAGMSGIAMSYRLKLAGIRHRVVEARSDVGGTWLENRYPGCRLDTNNFAYSYSFLQKNDWPNQYSCREEIWQYFREAAELLGVRENVAFDTSVTRLEYDEASKRWNVTVTSEGATERFSVDTVITAVGQLNQPKYPDVPGVESFAGEWGHTGTWDENIDVAGKRVAVVGAGASAYQVVPAIVDEVSELLLFQRTPPWMLPTPAYHEPVKPGMAGLLDLVPRYGRWFRFWQSWLATEGRLPLVTVDSDWDPGAHENTVSAANLQLRTELIDRMSRQYADQPEMLDRVVPNYPPGGKRLLRDNGVWARALTSPQTELITTPIDRVEQSGIRTADGRLHEVDVIVYATGFLASDFLSGIEVIGRKGQRLSDFWNGDAAAYKGTNVPGFPGLYLVFGPNTNLVVTGSAIFMSESSIEYVMQALRATLERGGAPLEVTEEAYRKYRDWVDAENRKRAWGVEGVTSWYKNRFGRVSQNWPFPLLTFFEITRRVDLDDYLPATETNTEE